MFSGRFRNPIDLHRPADLGTIFDLTSTSDIGPGETWELTMIVGSAPTLALARQALEDKGASVFGLASHARGDEGTQDMHFLGIAA